MTLTREKAPRQSPVRLSMLMEPELHRRLKIEAIEHGMTMREYITEIILHERGTDEKTEK